MDWLQLLALLVLSFALVLATLELFAKLLRAIARLRRPLPLLLGLVAYVAIACVFCLPMFGFQKIFGRHTNELFRIVSGFGYLACLAAAVSLFRRRHLAELRRLGYYRR